MDWQKYNNLIAHLAAGEDPHQLIREGYTKSSVNHPAEWVERGDYASPPTRCYVRATTNVLRLTQEQMVSPEPLWSRTLARL